MLRYFGFLLCSLFSLCLFVLLSTDENNVEEESAHDVHACVQALLGDRLRVLLDILDASKAAAVVVVVPMQRPSIPAKGKRISFRILSELFWAQICTLRRERICDDFIILVHLPG